MMLHKLRRAMVNPTREPLHGETEVDEAWIGGPQPGLRGSRQLKGPPGGAGGGRGRTARHGVGASLDGSDPRFCGPTIVAFARRHIAEGATIYTDQMTGFGGLTKAGYRHVARKQPLRNALAHGERSVVPFADRAIGNLQQWLIGTHHGVSRAQLQVCL